MSNTLYALSIAFNGITFNKIINPPITVNNNVVTPIYLSISSKLRLCPINPTIISKPADISKNFSTSCIKLVICLIVSGLILLNDSIKTVNFSDKLFSDSIPNDVIFPLAANLLNTVSIFSRSSKNLINLSESNDIADIPFNIFIVLFKSSAVSFVILSFINNESK